MIAKSSHWFSGSRFLAYAGQENPIGMMFMGSPAKPVREISDQEREMILRTAEKYHKLGMEYGNTKSVRRLI
jgi:carbonic anhydrase/acetyltransferase-like protein (isoleucine patch superfamily)